jgi:plasmid stabilization system protein ParE
MTVPIRFRSEVRIELTEAVDWYEERAPGLGAEFLRTVNAAIASIHRQPRAYPITCENIRRVVLRRFPYSIFYTATDQEILIVACIHGKRDPKRWQDRL